MPLSLPRTSATGLPAASRKDVWRTIGIPEVSPAETGLARQQALAAELRSRAAAPLLVAWRCRNALLVGRTETRLPRFAEACIELASAGWPVVRRNTGGRACPVAPGTVQISTIEAAAPDTAMDAKYTFLATLIQAALRGYRIECQVGAVADAYCPGRFDVTVEGRKIAGLSQHWFRNGSGVRCVITAASINVEEPPERLAEVVNRFYVRAGSSARCVAGALASVRQCGTMPTPAPATLGLAILNQVCRHF